MLFRSKESVDSVIYMGSSLPLDKYYQLLDVLDGNPNKISDEARLEVARRFNVSEGFIDAVDERYKYKFDVAFLDYFGGSYQKTGKAIERLLSRRMSDRGVFAVTTNVSPQINHTRGSSDEIAYSLFKKLANMESKTGVRFGRTDNLQYSDGESNHKMSFLIYEFTRDKESKS